MAALLTNQSLPSSSSSSFSRSFYQIPIPSKPHLFQYSKPFHPSLSLFSCHSTFLPHSSPPIFLPFLEGAEDEHAEEEDSELLTSQEPQVNILKKDEDLSDPILRFFKSQTSTKDPPIQGKLNLQSNRRSSWRLAPKFDSDAEPDTDDILNGGTNQIQASDTANSNLTPGSGGEIIRIARDLPENVTLGEKLGPYEGKISEEECLEILGMMGEESMMNCCLYFFEWMGLQEPSLVTPRACTVVFPLLGKANMGDQLMIFFRNLPPNKEFRDVHVYNATISGLLHCTRYDDACEVYETMEANNIAPDHVTCSIMITIMRKKGGSAKDAWEFFERMNRKGVKWTSEILGTLLKAFCDEGLKNEALIIQVEMAKKGIFPNAIVYNTLMDAYNKSNQIEEVEGLFTEMKIKGIKPTSATFNILMDAYSRRMQPEIVEKLLLEMQDAGLEPDAKSYTCLISAYGRQKKMSDMAANAFLRMKKAGIKPTSHSYTALIHAYSVSGWHEKAYIAFENMQSERIKPAMETYTALLDAFRHAGDIQMLMKIWKMMMRDKVEGTRVTFNVLLDGFAKQGQYAEARDVIFEFGKLGFQPTVMTYNMLMNAYARGGQHSKLPQLLKEMATLKLELDSITYLTMIYAYIRVRDFRRAFFYHKRMVKSGQVPDAKSYEKLRRILDAKAKIKNRKDKSAILGIINSKMGMVQVKKKGKKDEFWKNRKKPIRIRRVERRES